MSETLTAVLTGDLVMSEKLSAAVRKMVPDRLELCRRALLEHEVDVSEVDVYRGDGWQLLTRTPEWLPFIALFIRVELKAWREDLDSRAVGAVGTTQSTGDGDVSRGYGDAFTRSGRGLDSLPKDRRMAFSLHADDDAQQRLVNAATVLVDEVVTDWTAAQATAVSRAMRGQSQEEIGRGWPGGPISQQAVAQHLQRASWPAVRGWLDAMNGLIRSMDA